MKKFEIPFRNLAGVLLLGGLLAGCSAYASQPLPVALSDPLPDGSRVAMVSANDENLTVSSNANATFQCDRPIWIPGHAQPDRDKGVVVTQYSHWERGPCEVIHTGGGTVTGVAGQLLAPALGAAGTATGGYFVGRGIQNAAPTQITTTATAPTTVQGSTAVANAKGGNSASSSSSSSSSSSTALGGAGGNSTVYNQQSNEQNQYNNQQTSQKQGQYQ